jgi:hypothetical protein
LCDSPQLLPSVPVLRGLTLPSLLLFPLETLFSFNFNYFLYLSLRNAKLIRIFRLPFFFGWLSVHGLNWNLEFTSKRACSALSKVISLAIVRNSIFFTDYLIYLHFPPDFRSRPTLTLFFRSIWREKTFEAPLTLLRSPPGSPQTRCNTPKDFVFPYFI